jgi:parvulin-like peptidyl-prolyl isomerase
MGGDTGFKTRDELAKQYGQPVADATQALKAVGDLAGPVETERGLVIVRLAARQLGFDQPFDSVKPRIASRLQLEKRSKVMDEYVASLRKSAKVEIDEAVLDKVEVRPEGSGGTAAAKR